MMRQISEISIEEEKMMDSPFHLSANAPPFYPDFHSNVNIAIYNDGIPCLTLVSEQDIFNVLNGIEDPVECYPPDASEAAELDAVDEFVETMATLNFLEELEERARNDFTHVKKRWEARRSDGLKGRPHPAKNLVQPVIHLPGCAVPHNADIRTLVKSMPVPPSDSLSLHDLKMQGKAPKHVTPRNSAHKHVIQQPRKQN